MIKFLEEDGEMVFLDNIYPLLKGTQRYIDRDFTDLMISFARDSTDRSRPKLLSIFIRSLE